MNKFYILNNSSDSTLFYKNSKFDTRLISESKRFINRRSAEKFLLSNNLSEKYSVRMHRNTVINESMDKDDIINEIQSALDDTKDFIDTTVDVIESCYSKDDDSLNEEIFGGSNIEDVLDKLKKMQKYMSGIAFTPSFDNSLGSSDKKVVITPNEANPTSSESGDSSE